jgi:Lrp/AsnC family leucine-responsive transcriptional regulator
VSTLDGKDLSLLRALQLNARVRMEDLGRAVGLAASSVHERLRRLDHNGVIRRWTIEIAPEKLGLHTLALIGIRSSRTCSSLVTLLEPLPEVEECHSVAGDFSLILKVRVGSPSDLLAFIERLREMPGIDSTMSFVALKTFFERGPQPTELPGR